MPLLARCCGGSESEELCDYASLSPMPSENPHDLLLVWAFMWNITFLFSHFPDCYIPPPLNTLTQSGM